MQMGVEVDAVAEPVSAETRRTLRKLDRIEPIPGKVEGAGPVFAFTHNSNAAFHAVNDILAAGGKVAFAKTENAVYVTGAAGILQKNGVDATSHSMSHGAAISMPAGLAGCSNSSDSHSPWYTTPICKTAT
jgi:hypothetical protein